MRYLVIIGIIFLAVGAYLCFRVRKMMEFYGLDMHKLIWRLVSLVIAGVLAGLGCNLFSNTAVAVLHFIAVLIVIDILSALLGAATHKLKKNKFMKVCTFLHKSGIAAAVIAAAIVIYGFLNMQSVIKTEYSVFTEKDIKGYKVVLLTDIHYDTIQKPEIFKDVIDDINAQEPDIVLLGGDIVEEGTSKERMEELFGILGNIHNKYGIYYVYGNHDRQPYTNRRTYTNKELADTIKKNNIKILEDEYVEISDDLIIAGRSDSAWGNVNKRPAPEEILNDADREKYIIMLDHQPVEANENNAAGVDLELSGHTHAGQIWPVGLFTELSGKMNYGEYHTEGCTTIVSSGVAGWRYKLRTGEHCEYVVVNIERSNG